MSTPQNAYSQITLATSKNFGLSVADGGASTPDVAVPVDAVGVMLQAEAQSVRFRYDGTAPTSSVGMILVAGDAPVLITGKDAIRNLKVIEVAASAKLNISFVAS